MRVPDHEGPSRRLAVVDGLRAIAAPMVAWLHVHGTSQGLTETLPAPVDALFRTFGVGVQIFFVVSGFAIAHALDGVVPSPSTFARFVARRVVRLDPPYWVSIALAVVTARVADLVLHRAPSPLPSSGDLLAHATYTVPFVGTPLIQDIYWTLMVEFQFYVVLFLLAWMGHHLARIHPSMTWLPLAAMTTWGLAVRFLGVAPPHPGLGLWTHWHVFAMGIACSYLHRGLLPSWSVPALAAVIVVVSRLDLALSDLVGLATGLFLWLALRRDAQDRWLAHPVMQWFGRISYSLYLLHPVFGQRVANLGYRVVGTSPVAAWSVAFVAMGTCVLAAWAMCRFIEQPAMAWARRIPRQRVEPT